jgi:hypothetical protein
MNVILLLYDVRV